MLDQKYSKLLAYLKTLDSAVLAFSGGVDSTFLLHAGKEALGDRFMAVTVASPYIPQWELEEAKALAEEMGVKHHIFEVEIIDTIKNNPENRCYLCKKAIFSQIMEYSNRQGFHHVIDGTNFDDLGDYRPGMIALKELEIVSPLLVCEFTKNDIRTLSKKFDLPTWDKPAYACLLTRIPYGEPLEIETLERIERSETYMMSLGFRAVRVRTHGKLARIEVNQEDRQRLFDTDLLDTIASTLKSYGFDYVTMDLEGYRMGSFNATLGSLQTDSK